MKLDNSALLSFFNLKDIRSLYHANSLATSITFIKQGGLMSRGLIEKKGFDQTAQTSDDDDKKFDVWNDIFLDSIDLHGYFPRQNLYGPISFKFNLDFLKDNSYEISITKNNPIYWTDSMNITDKYFSSVQELSNLWESFERHRMMITIKNSQTPILFDFLEQILVDDPRVKIEEIICYDECMKSLETVIGHNLHLRNKIKTRECGLCFCRQNYLRQLNTRDLKRLFFPITKQN